MTEYDLNDVDRAHSVSADTERPKQRRRDKRDVHGWVVLDKPVGMKAVDQATGEDIEGKQRAEGGEQPQAAQGGAE